MSSIPCVCCEGKFVPHWLAHCCPEVTQHSCIFERLCFFGAHLSLQIEPSVISSSGPVYDDFAALRKQKEDQRDRSGVKNACSSSRGREFSSNTQAGQSTVDTYTHMTSAHTDKNRYT